MYGLKRTRDVTCIREEISPTIPAEHRDNFRFSPTFTEFLIVLSDFFKWIARTL